MKWSLAILSSILLICEINKTIQIPVPEQKQERRGEAVHCQLTAHHCCPQAAFSLTMGREMRDPPVPFPQGTLWIQGRHLFKQGWGLAGPRTSCLCKLLPSCVFEPGGL